MERLMHGYKRFMERYWAENRAVFQALAAKGQSPRAMVIACCDSRVSPEVIFDTEPGEIFVVRNVANLVPPYAPDSDNHGTSAALEFAVRNLKVDHIIVMGHSQCGGIRALVEDNLSDDDDFIGPWMKIATVARQRSLEAAHGVCRHLDLLADRKFPELIRICGVDSADLSDMIHELRMLDPRPGDRFESTAAQAITPDILMRPAHDGGWTIELNPDTLPRVLVNRRYHAEISRSCRNVKEREYLNERMNAANWLVRSLDQRANTILKVASEIVSQQQEFFVHGVSHLRPLVLRNIAEIIGMHESTVSRVTSNKYIATPRGLFELKYFFSSAIARTDGEGSFSAEAIRHRLRGLIEAESPNAILSDDTLVERLQAEGIDIARRTVAKYREQLNIPSSVQRRRQKNFSARATR